MNHISHTTLITKAQRVATLARRRECVVVGVIGVAGIASIAAGVDVTEMGLSETT